VKEKFAELEDKVREKRRLNQPPLFVSRKTLFAQDFSREICRAQFSLCNFSFTLQFLVTGSLAARMFSTANLGFTFHAHLLTDCIRSNSSLPFTCPLVR